MFGALTDAITASGWAYAIIAAIAFLDSFFPLVPSETAVITGGVLASAGDLSIELVLISATAGAFAGDNFTYGLGRVFGDRLSRRLFRGKRAMTDAQLAASYRGGQGVGWIMRHRLGGLMSTGLVRRQGDRIVLTSTGAIIAMLYRVAIAVLGLKVTG